MLPGFQNAFETSTPMKSPSKRLNKGKGKMEYSPLAVDSTFYNTSRDLSQQNLDILQFPPEDGINAFQESEARPLSASSLTFEPGQAKDEDTDVIAIINEENEDTLLLDSIEDVNWKLEVCQLFSG